MPKPGSKKLKPEPEPAIGGLGEMDGPEPASGMPEPAYGRPEPVSGRPGDEAPLTLKAIADKSPSRARVPATGFSQLHFFSFSRFFSFFFDSFVLPLTLYFILCFYVFLFVPFFSFFNSYVLPLATFSFFFVSFSLSSLSNTDFALSI